MRKFIPWVLIFIYSVGSIFANNLLPLYWYLALVPVKIQNGFVFVFSAFSVGVLFWLFYKINYRLFWAILCIFLAESVFVWLR